MLYDTPYYFWIYAEDIHGQDSSLVAFTGSPIEVLKGEWLRNFQLPWKMTGRTSTKYSWAYPSAELVYTVPANRVVLIQGYKLTGVGSKALSFDGTEFENTTCERTPQTTNGMYIGAGSV